MESISDVYFFQAIRIENNVYSYIDKKFPFVVTKDGDTIIIMGQHETVCTTTANVKQWKYKAPEKDEIHDRTREQDTGKVPQAKSGKNFKKN